MNLKIPIYNIILDEVNTAEYISYSNSVLVFIIVSNLFLKNKFKNVLFKINVL